MSAKQYNIIDIPNDLHHLIAQYLNHVDLKHMSQILLPFNGSYIYKKLSWRSIIVIGNKDVRSINISKRAVPTKAFVNPSRYSWFESKEVFKVSLSDNIYQTTDDFIYSLSFSLSSYPRLESIGIVISDAADLRTLLDTKNSVIKSEKVLDLIDSLSVNYIKSFPKNPRSLKNLKEFKFHLGNPIEDESFIRLLRYASNCLKLNSFYVSQPKFTRESMNALKLLRQKSLESFRVAFGPSFSGDLLSEDIGPIQPVNQISYTHGLFVEPIIYRIHLFFSSVDSYSIAAPFVDTSFDYFNRINPEILRTLDIRVVNEFNDFFLIASIFLRKLRNLEKLAIKINRSSYPFTPSTRLEYEAFERLYFMFTEIERLSERGLYNNVDIDLLINQSCRPRDGDVDTFPKYQQLLVKKLLQNCFDITIPGYNFFCNPHESCKLELDASVASVEETNSVFLELCQIYYTAMNYQKVFQSLMGLSKLEYLSIPYMDLTCTFPILDELVLESCLGNGSLKQISIWKKNWDSAHPYQIVSNYLGLVMKDFEEKSFVLDVEKLRNIYSNYLNSNTEKEKPGISTLKSFKEKILYSQKQFNILRSIQIQEMNSIGSERGRSNDYLKISQEKKEEFNAFRNKSKDSIRNLDHYVRKIRNETLSSVNLLNKMNRESIKSYSDNNGIVYYDGPIESLMMTEKDKFKGWI